MTTLSKLSLAALAVLMVVIYPTTVQAGLPVPEPGGTASLMGLAILGLLAVGRKLRR